MIELGMMLAKILPFKDLTQQLTGAIEEYNLDPSEDNKRSVITHATMICMNGMTEDKTMEESIDMVKENQEKNDFFESIKNPSN